MTAPFPATKTRRDYRHPITGTKLPGVTTVLGNLGWKTNSLMHWAWRLGTEGKSYASERDDAAGAGTLAHLFIEQSLRGEELKAPEGTSSEQLAKAATALAAFEDWKRKHSLEIVAQEVALVDGAMSFGGTIDLIARIDGVLTIVDWKTGRAYDEHVIQLAAYRHLWDMHSTEPILAAMIVRVPTDGTPAIEIGVSLDALNRAKAIFAALALIHHTKDAVKLPHAAKEAGAL